MIKMSELAKFIGESAAKIHFVWENGGGKNLLKLALPLFATQTFIVSDKFSPRVKSVIESAVRNSELPEGVVILNPRDLDGLDKRTVPPNFAVVSPDPHNELQEANKTNVLGGLVYTLFNWQVQELTKRLNHSKL